MAKFYDDKSYETEDYGYPREVLELLEAMEKDGSQAYAFSCSGSSVKNDTDLEVSSGIVEPKGEAVTAVAPLTRGETISTLATLPFEGARSADREATLPFQRATSLVREATLPFEGARSADREATLPFQRATSLVREATLPFEGARSTDRENTLPFESAAKPADRENTLPFERAAKPADREVLGALRVTNRANKKNKKEDLPPQKKRQNKRVCPGRG
jgi:hypothetical protein